MRSVLLCTLLLAGWSSPVFSQQLKEITNSVGMKLVLIHAGSFTMGSPEGEIGRQENETPHEVTISNSYYLGVFEVTQGEYEKVIEERPSVFIGIHLPVNQISREDAVTFCKKLSDLPEEKATGRNYRLPTEAEWEYACRANSPTAYCFGDSTESLGEYAWFDTNDGRTPHPVGQKKPNRWGLYDMHGNVWEWCNDWYIEYPSGAAINPSGPRGGKSFVFRGGSWSNPAASCRSAHRFTIEPTFRSGSLGFRVALSPPAKQPEAAPSK